MQVWGSRLQIVLNNYSNGDPFSPKLRQVQSVSVASSQQSKHSEAQPRKKLKKGMPRGAMAESLAIERLSAFR